MSLFTTGKKSLLLALNTVYQWHCDNLLFCGNLLLSSAINIPAYCLNLEKNIYHYGCSYKLHNIHIF